MKNKVSIIASMAIMVALATATFAGCSKANNDNKLESTSSIIEVRDESSAGEDSKVESSVESQFEKSKVESSVESQDESDFVVESSSLSSASEISQNVRASNDESSAEEKSEVETSTEISISEKSEVESSKVESSLSDNNDSIYIVVEPIHIETSDITRIGRMKEPIYYAFTDAPESFHILDGKIAIVRYSDNKALVCVTGPSIAIPVDVNLIIDQGAIV